MYKLFKKLDLDSHIKRLESFFVREKSVVMQGDSNIHYSFINDLLKYNFQYPKTIDNLDDSLMRLKKSAVLRYDQIFYFYTIIRYFLYLKKYEFKDGVVKKWLEEIKIPDQILEYNQYFTKDGKIANEIDKELDSSISIKKDKQKQLQNRLTQIASLPKLSTYLVDRQIHLINEQEALLLRAGYNHVLKGSIIGRSLGGFFYVVPNDILKIKKEIEYLQSRIEEIIYNIEKEISAVLSGFVMFLSFINKAYDKFDHYQARVQFIRDYNLEIIKSSNNNSVTLSNFKHPALSNPKPLNLDFKKSVLLITGVNAGGKTMFLKSILSACVMAKYLIPFSCNKDKSSIGRFKHIEAIIDDPQNVAADISTFAGRMQAFSKLFKLKNAIIGVDEIELGTDSDEASALFKVMIEELLKRGIKIVITTHHKRLAALLSANREVELLAAIYDENRRVPTYTFLQGSIGKSYAFETASRYGIADYIIKFAKDVYGEEKEKLNDLIERSTQLELELALKGEKLKNELDSVYESKKSLLMQKSEVANLLQKERERLEREYAEAIKEAKLAIKAKDEQSSHRHLNKANRYYKTINKEKEIEKKDFSIGDYVQYGTSKGVIAKIKGKEATIDFDGRVMRASVSMLKAIKKPPKPKKEQIKLDISKPLKPSVQLDLHGLRAEEAIEQLDGFISQSLVMGFDEVLIYHGIGTGRLSRVVKEFLASHPSVIDFGDAPMNMGGFGATVAKL